MSDKLRAYVDASIRDSKEPVIGWYQKGGPVHVEKEPGETLCGLQVETGTKWSKGPARVLLRRTNGCSNCYDAAPELEDV